jgi:hypothetical protein
MKRRMAGAQNKEIKSRSGDVLLLWFESLEANYEAEGYFLFARSMARFKFRS